MGVPAGHHRALQTDLGLELASLLELQLALLQEMLMVDHREEEAGSAEIAGSEAIAGRTIATLKDSMMEDDLLHLPDAAHPQWRRKLPLVLEELNADDFSLFFFA